MAPMLEEVGKKMGAVVERIASGDHVGAAEQFVETVALGPGSWARLPHELQQTFVTNAPTFLDEARDPEQLVFDLAWIRGFPHPLLLTMGDQSPPMFAPVIAKLGAARGEVAIFSGQAIFPMSRTRARTSKRSRPSSASMRREAPVFDEVIP